MKFVKMEEILQLYPEVKRGDHLLHEINTILTTFSNEDAWVKLSKEILTKEMPFQLHLYLFSVCYPQWHEFPLTAPAFKPDFSLQENLNLYQVMRETNQLSVMNFHEWSVTHRSAFWKHMINKLNIQFEKKPTLICDLTEGVEKPKWLVGAKFNICDSCFPSDVNKIAVIQQTHQGNLQQFTYGELNSLSNQIANSLIKNGFKPADRIAIDMPMHFQAVAIYLGIIKMGGVVVSIADSFSPDEISLRLKITNAKAIFTQDFISRQSKMIALYEKIVQANAPQAIVLALNQELNCVLRDIDLFWNNFLTTDSHFDSYTVTANSACNILFSSGTTGEPKAIPWSHTTPIKAAVDAFLHHNIQPNDILAWPTNLGWMMGPWLIFASLINHAAMALYDGAPTDSQFGEFVERAKVTMLGVVPTLVANWRQSNSMIKYDWHHIKCFSSTGECSNPEDMLYLMSLGNYKPIIEYCGGTEIGGAYVSSTLMQNNYPAIFSAKVFGLDFVLLDEKNQLTDCGEVALIPPSIGLSLSLLNADHHQIYFENMPDSTLNQKLRRHGDQLKRIESDFYLVLGRVDDTMNLGGIKVSSAEIERALVGIENIIETAAIATPIEGLGPSQLIIFAVVKQQIDKKSIKVIMQSRINQHLNPLFKIHEVIFINELPKTASNKIMRRVLRKKYQAII